ncbi:hypothetical protein [Sphingomonas sp. SUN039]|uniref:hypothetical protein n=1 Tax=Sphingomonas sp. SUN039 TaxID=2937787 RepID=UPI0021642B8F|nr:hypothetical protein [Sphingomonas sp. SUN039]UVO53727.1 hypothetical protein M0209_06180 [Sphingomonas sp. SUN039]
MSRHTLEPRPDQPRGTRITVGWDRPLATFFAQVLVTEADGEDDVIFWQGTAPGELATAAAALALLAPCAVVPEGLAATLETDRLKSLGTANGPAQQRARLTLRHRD